MAKLSLLYNIQIIMKDEVQSPREEKTTDNELEGNPLQLTVNRYISLWRIVSIVANISLGSFYFGYTIIYLSVIDFDTIIIIFDIQISRNAALGMLTFCVPVGGLIGSFFSSYFIQHFSRRQSILYINYFAFALGFFVFFQNIKFYMLVRLFQGICAGLYSALVPLLIKQFVPQELSGSLGTFHQLFITIGIFFSCFFSYCLSIIQSDSTGHSFWRIIFGFPLITIAIQTIILHVIYPLETPKYLITNNKESQALRLIAFIYKPEYVDEVYRQLMAQNYLKDNQINSPDSSNVSVNRTISLTTIVAFHLALLQQLVGISAVSIYAGYIAQGNLKQFKPILPSIINFEQVVTTIISSFVLAKIGRKTVLQAGTLAAVGINFIIGIGFLLSSSHPSLSVRLILFGLFLFMANFGLSLGPVVWMYIPQIVKPHILPYSTMVNWGSSALVILLFPIIKQQLPDKNPGFMFLFFSIWCLGSYFFNAKYVVETKGKSESQIFREYQKLENK